MVQADIVSGLVGKYTFESGDATDSTGIIGDGTNISGPGYAVDAGRGGTVLEVTRSGGDTYVSVADALIFPWVLRIGRSLYE